jgi:hypothetical protein
MQVIILRDRPNQFTLRVTPIQHKPVAGVRPSENQSRLCM